MSTLIINTLLLLLLLLQGLSPILSRPDNEKRLSTGSDISGSSLDKILERSEEQRKTTPVHSIHEESSQEDTKTRRCGGWGCMEVGVAWEACGIT